MLRFCPIAAFALLFMVFLVPATGNATVIVTAPSNGTCIDITPGLYTTLDDIDIAEGSKNDFPSQSSRTLILTVPAGFEFMAGTGTVGPAPHPSRNITAISISVTTTTITVTFSVSGTNNWDNITISGIRVRALSYNVSGNILRLSGAAGGTATIVGDAGGAGINHGYLQSESTSLVTSIANGNWSNPATWSNGMVPSCTDTIVVDHTVSADISATTRTLIITTNGHLTSNMAVTVDSSFIIQGNGFYTHNNLASSGTTIFKGTENFSTTSTITILRWYNTAVAFPNAVTGNFGNITFNQGATWNQQGLFAPARIKGTLTVSSGTVTMDEGVGMTTSLTLADVVVNNTGALIMASGSARNLTLITGNYTDTSTSATRSSIMLNSQGSLNWTANGNVFISHSWSAYQHSGSNAGNTTININGNLSIAGGAFDINTDVNAPLNLTVTGNTTISGSPTYVRFIDRNSGDLTFTTQNFYITGGTATTLMGGNSPTGNAAITILNDFTLTGAGVIAQLYNNNASTGSLQLNVGHDLIVTSGELRVAGTNGTVDILTGRNLDVLNSGSLFRGQINPLATGDLTLYVTGDFTNTSGTVRISEGICNIEATVVESVNNTAGTFYGIYNPTAVNNGIATLECNHITLAGGNFSFYHALASDGKTISVTVHTNISITFNSGTDLFSFLPVASTNNALLNLVVENNFTVNNDVDGAYFLSSASSGDETIAITNNFTVNGSDVYFVGDENILANTHNITTSIGGNVTITGGNTRFSTGAGTATITTGGDVNISGGELTLKYNTGVATWTISGNYSQSSGTFNIHSQNATTPNSCTVTINGDFSFTNGTFNFDNYATGTGLAEHLVYINGASYTLDGNAIITHANNLTTNFIFGQIIFSRPGTTTYSRNSATNEIRHVKYTVNSGTTVDASSSVNGFQMTSIQSNNPVNHNSLNIYGVLNMNNKILSARQYSNYYSRITVRDGGRYRTSHTGGLYSGNSSVSSSINGYVTTFNRVNYTLEPNSTVEYYGTATTMVTGIPNGIANSNLQKYGILEINFTGSPGITWVYPESTDEVFIRTQLILTEGEFNLDDDHVTISGGRAIMLENGATVSRTSGFIRSETEDGSGLVKWNITTNGSYTIPFGYDATNYIPLTYQQTSGSSGTIALGTYRSLADNTPLPPSVTHVRDVSGNDNSAFTVDRFWYLSVPGAAVSSLTFSYVASEGSGIISPRAQLWEPVTLGWFPPAVGQSNPTGSTTLAPGLSSFNNWWTLSAASSPLPIELIWFDVRKLNAVAQLSWATATEINNHHFTIERSSNGTEFLAIGRVPGAGNSTSVTNYTYADEQPNTGINYYRLKQTDYDGRFSYSDIKAVTFNIKSQVTIYPNPVAQHDVLYINFPDEGKHTISILTITGQEIMKRDFSQVNGVEISIAGLNLCKGMYFVSVAGPDNTLIEKIAVR